VSELNDALAELRHERDQKKAELTRQSEQTLESLRNTLLLVGVATFAAILVGGYVVVGVGLFPLRRVSEAVSQVSEKDFHLPLDRDELPKELAPIVDRLTHTLDALGRAFEREKQAVADISHELRTPLASLLTTLDVALRKPRSAEDYRATLSDCRDIGKQLNHLVERIMTLAYLDAGTDRVKESVVDGADLAGGCATMIRPLAEAHGLTLNVNVQPGLRFQTDPDKLREVLMNLLHNAVEYNQPGGAIHMAGRRETPNRIVLEVRDTGIGMPADVKDRIFERFYRADPSRHETGVHAGLGLAIVKEYVTRLGGTIAVESQVGAGSRFRVELPAATLAAEQAA
jgi:signal transduction histidine kinase